MVLFCKHNHLYKTLIGESVFVFIILFPLTYGSSFLILPSFKTMALMKDLIITFEQYHAFNCG